MHINNIFTYGHLEWTTKICMGMTDTNFQLLITEEGREGLGRQMELSWYLNYIIFLLRKLLDNINIYTSGCWAYTIYFTIKIEKLKYMQSRKNRNQWYDTKACTTAISLKDLVFAKKRFKGSPSLLNGKCYLLCLRNKDKLGVWD